MDLFGYLGLLWIAGFFLESRVFLVKLNCFLRNSCTSLRSK
uniref:Uncharacterized protein n=1 Tax=Arundo donax TaxID=35708 RepID=A0A0A8Z1Q4_ARUDO